jgi:hypothetical protein
VNFRKALNFSNLKKAPTKNPIFLTVLLFPLTYQKNKTGNIEIFYIQRLQIDRWNEN